MVRNHNRKLDRGLRNSDGLQSTQSRGRNHLALQKISIS